MTWIRVKEDGVVGSDCIGDISKAQQTEFANGSNVGWMRGKRVKDVSNIVLSIPKNFTCHQSNSSQYHLSLEHLQ